MSGALNARFSAEAAAWDSNKGHILSSQNALEALRKYVPEVDQDGGKGENGATEHKRLDVLEIGCGTGLLSFMVAPNVRSLVGVDTAEGMIAAFSAKLAQPNAPTNLVPVCKLIEDPDDPQLQTAARDLFKTVGADDAAGEPARFDLIISHLTLHHIPSLPSILGLMYGCLRPGGRIALTDFEYTGEESILFHPESKREGVERHGIEPVEMAGLMKAAGFEEVKVPRVFAIDKDVKEVNGKKSFPYVLSYGRKR